MHIIELGVREFLNITLKSGGLSAEFTPRMRAVAGTEAHTCVTSRRPEAYQREVSIRHSFQWQGFRLVIRGRIDGQMPQGDMLVVEEIKSTFRALDAIDPEDAPFHLAQLQLYHHFAVQHHPGKRIIPVLTYVNLRTLEERSFTLEWTPEESCEFFETLAVKLLQQEAEKARWRKRRNDSLRRLQFPFSHLRSGQVELIGTVEQAIAGHRDLLAEAATGIGKTMGVLYPAIRHLASRRKYSRIFFLTAKSAGVEVVRNAIGILRDRGMHLRVLYLQAKERICPFAAIERPECDERDCPYAVDFYDKVERIMPELLAQEELTPELIRDVARREEICPFELSLELSLQCDLIVCDYNYVFDPSVYLRRFFFPGLPNDHLFLVDEAHNLVTRSREMYSATLSEHAIAEIRELFGFAYRDFHACLGELLRQFASWRQDLEFEGGRALRLVGVPPELMTWVEGVLDLASDMLLNLPKTDRRKRLLDLYFDLSRFSRTAAELTSEYAVFVMSEGRTRELLLRLFCLHPGPLLRTRVERSVSTIFFSATLSPSGYFTDLLGVRPGSITLSLPSPFPPEHRLYLHVPAVSTRYVAREETKLSVARVIMDVAQARVGNYLAFFPSYAYIGAVWAEMMVSGAKDALAVHVQQPNMSQEQQAAFLHKVCTNDGRRSTIGLAVMGGLFGEAVDLPGEKLIGTIIVGPGLPGIGPEQELIREYFDEERDGAGFYYAYQVPGIIRVIQAAGRVFRTQDDRGVVVLMDDRFLEEPYPSLLPEDWCARDEGFSTQEYRELLEWFWEGR